MWWLIALLATGLVLFLILGSRDDKELQPPLRNGWLPWLGCAMEMGKEPLKFINITRKEVSDLLELHDT